MKFFSLFTKTPAHQRFNFTPRYYDQKKEEMREREIRIRKELQLEQQNEDEAGDYRSRIAGSFQAARKRSKPSSAMNSSLLRFGILLFLVLFIMAYLTWGKTAVYGFFLFIPFYIYLKFRKS
jgi:Flp pilus assembly protein TadB